MTASEDIEKRNKIMTAAIWKSDKENPDFGDVNYKAFVQVMTYRRKIAKQYLENDNEKMKGQIEDILNDCNDKIKKILGL